MIRIVSVITIKTISKSPLIAPIVIVAIKIPVISKSISYININYNCRKKNKEVEDSYFKDEINAFNNIDEESIFTDVDDYNSYNDLDSDYDNDPWGYSTNDDSAVVVNINVRNRFRNYWDFYSNRNDKDSKCNHHKNHF